MMEPALAEPQPAEDPTITGFSLLSRGGLIAQILFRGNALGRNLTMNRELAHISLTQGEFGNIRQSNLETLLDRFQDLLVSITAHE